MLKIQIIEKSQNGMYEEKHFSYTYIILQYIILGNYVKQQKVIKFIKKLQCFLYKLI